MTGTDESGAARDACDAGPGDPSTASGRTSPCCVPPQVCADPSQMNDDELNAYGIPPRPDATDQPELSDLWYATFGRTLRFVKYRRPPEQASTGRLTTTPPDRTVPPVPGFRTRFETSRNWSGAYINAGAGSTFKQIWASWNIPTVRQPPGAAPPDPCTHRGADGEIIDNDCAIEYQCSVWIGLDGQRRYVNASLPQVGTLQSLKVAVDGSETPDTYAWTQWWARDDDKAVPVPINGFDLAADDNVTAILTSRSDQQVLCTLLNNSAAVPTVIAVIVDAPPLLETVPNGPKFSITGATAEWIVERPAFLPGEKDDPSPFAQPRLRAFPDYGSVHLSSCYASRSPIAGGPPTTRDIAAARFIRIFEMRRNPVRTAFISMPSRIDGTTFETAYGGFPG